MQTKRIEKILKPLSSKRRLDILKVLKEEGIEIPTDLNIRVIEDTPNTQTLVIPPATQSASAEKIENRLAAITLP